MDSPVVSAALFGLISSLSLPLGALLGISWQPRDRMMAVFLAFGGGALLAALTLDLVGSALDHGHFQALAAGAIGGGVVFKLLNHLINRKGGYLRKPSTAITYWRGRANQRLRQIVNSAKRIQIVHDLDDRDIELLLPHVLLREFADGTVLYRPGDPSGNGYIIETGRVDLIVPDGGPSPYKSLGDRDAFGRLGFLTGAPRFEQAVARADTRLVIIPRAALIKLLENSVDAQEAVSRRLKEPDVRAYLTERHGMSAEMVDQWVDRSIRSLQTTGSYDPPVGYPERDQNLPQWLQQVVGTTLFTHCQPADLDALAKRLILKTTVRGHNFYHYGQLADRLHLVRDGSVAVFDPQDRSQRPLLLTSGAAFGTRAFLTEGTHTKTAVADTSCAYYELRRKDFDALLAESPALQKTMAAYFRLGDLSTYLTDRQKIDTRQAAAWLETAVKSIQAGRLFPSLSEMTQTVHSHSGAAMAIVLGIVLDGIPESFVIGANVLMQATVSFSLIGGLFLANFPEALSSSASMKAQGFSTVKIMSIWIAIMLMTGICAGLGAIVLNGAPATLFSLLEGIAAGAMLTVVAETMLPEAFLKGGGVVGLSTLAGFLMAILFKTLN
jgi:CRP-like cAMP-binding protein